MTLHQEYLLKLLNEIDEICEDNDINYYAFAGTMLGVERNEGILPWDDDIDIIMTKANYDKFVEVMKTTPIENRKFELIEDNKDYPLQFGRYTSLDTTALTRSLAFGNVSAGIWIDIIYVVPAPNSPKKLELIKRWFSVYCEMENEVYVEHTNHYDGFYWRYKIGKVLIKVLGKEFVLSKMRKNFNGFSEEDCTKYLMYHSLFTDYRFFDKHYFEKPVRKSFEGGTICVSPYNREFCRELYGDSWMYVPEKSEQTTHKMVLDLEIPYNMYVDDYMCFLDKQEIAKVVSKTKYIELDNYRKQNKKQDRVDKLNGLLLNETIKRSIQKRKIDLDYLLEQNEHKKILEFYNDCLNKQLITNNNHLNIYLQLEDKLLKPLLKSFICYKGQYYIAEKILEKKKETKQKYEDVYQLIHICKQLSIALWDKQEIDLVRNYVVMYRSIYNNSFCIDIELAECYIMINEASKESDYKSIRRKLLYIMEICSDNGECIKLLADIETLLGNDILAEELYSKAKNCTNNGIVLLDIKKKEAERNENKSDNTFK